MNHIAEQRALEPGREYVAAERVLAPTALDADHRARRFFLGFRV